MPLRGDVCISPGVIIRRIAIRVCCHAVQGVQDGWSVGFFIIFPKIGLGIDGLFRPILFELLLDTLAQSVYTDPTHQKLNARLEAGFAEFSSLVKNPDKGFAHPQEIGHRNEFVQHFSGTRESGEAAANEHLEAMHGDSFHFFNEGNEPNVMNSADYAVRRTTGERHFEFAR